MFGLHPALSALMPFRQAGQLRRRASRRPAERRAGRTSPRWRTWRRRHPGRRLRTGWIDRMVGLSGAAGPSRATVVGGHPAPTPFSGPSPEITMASVDASSIGGERPASRRRAGTWPSGACTPARRPSCPGRPSRTLATLGTTARLKDGPYAPAPAPPIPTGDLGNALRDVARLIKSDVGRARRGRRRRRLGHARQPGRSDWAGCSGNADELGQALAAFAAGPGRRARQRHPGDTVGVRPAGRRERLGRPGPRARQRLAAARWRCRRRARCTALAGAGASNLVNGTWPAPPTTARILAEVLEKRAASRRPRCSRRCRRPGWAWSGRGRDTPTPTTGTPGRGGGPAGPPFVVLRRP